MEEHLKCLICNNYRLKILPRYEKAYLCKCKNCGFVFSKFNPGKEELSNYYEGYGKIQFISNSTIKRYNQLLDNFEQYRKYGRILDVGCGSGHFLEVAKQRGWDVYGTEIIDSAIENCRKKGIKISKGNFESINFANDFFDVITSFEVLEHIYTPREEILLFRRILRKGGLVYITTPNFNSFLRYFLNENYNVISYPEHLVYFTPKTLRKLFSVGKFKIKKIEATGFSFSRLRSEMAITRVSSDSPDEKIRKKIDNHKLLIVIKKILNACLTYIGKGDSLKGWFIKEE